MLLKEKSCSFGICYDWSEFFRNSPWECSPVVTESRVAFSSPREGTENVAVRPSLSYQKDRTAPKIYFVTAIMP